jgi:glutamyl-tRNA synthetase
MRVRTRIAPSPTGLLHIGTARTALFNYLFAKKYGGEFLLRIEDTDTARNTKESYDAITHGLAWLGMQHDENIEYQSKRGELYKEKIEELVNKGMAYYSYISEDDISIKKEEAHGNNQRYIHRYSPQDEVKIEGVPPVVRLKVHAGVHIVIDDAVQGRVVINTDTIEDFILARSDSSPVYMFAVVCDDIDMQITHIIRGVDHLTNTAKQILLYQAFGINLPVFAHIPLIHGEDGAKLSKRHGAISTLEYKTQGYLPEAIRSYLLRLGWSNGNDDILNDEQAICVFNLEGIGRSPSRFDIAKLQNISEFFIKNSTNERLCYVLEKDYNFDFSQIINTHEALNLIKNRSKTLLELIDGILLFKKEMKQEIPLELEKATKIQEFMLSVNETQNLHDEFKLFLEKNGLKFKDVGPIFRVMLIGCTSSIGVFDIIKVLGFFEAKNRVINFKNFI